VTALVDAVHHHPHRPWYKSWWANIIIGALLAGPAGGFMGWLGTGTQQVIVAVFCGQRGGTYAGAPVTAPTTTVPDAPGTQALPKKAGDRP
jgi:hypothetical protein